MDSSDNESLMEEPPGENMYWAEKILGRKINKSGKPLYLVKWLNYDNKSNSWEPADCFDTCPELLADYDARHPFKTSKLNNSRSTSRVSSVPSEPKVVIAVTKLNESGTKNPSDCLKSLIRFTDGSIQLIKNTEVRSLCPQLLIEYYERHIQMKSIKKKKLKIKDEPSQKKVLKIEDTRTI